MAFKSPLFTQLNGFASHEDKVNRAFPIKSVTDVAADRPQGAGLFARFAFAGAVCVSAGRKTGGLGRTKGVQGRRWLGVQAKRINAH